LPNPPVPDAPVPADLRAAAPELDEPPLPEEVRAAVAAMALAPTLPLEATPRGRLHVAFAAGLAADELQAAMTTVRDLFRERPGQTEVTVHLPRGSGQRPLPMELRSGVAYDAELVAELSRRLRPGLVAISLADDESAGAPPA
jgi:hypothetical protein